MRVPGIVHFELQPRAFPVTDMARTLGIFTRTR